MLLHRRVGDTRDFGVQLLVDPAAQLEGCKLNATAAGCAAATLAVRPRATLGSRSVHAAMQTSAQQVLLRGTFAALAAEVGVTSRVVQVFELTPNKMGAARCASSGCSNRRMVALDAFKC